MMWLAIYIGAGVVLAALMGWGLARAAAKPRPEPEQANKLPEGDRRIHVTWTRARDLARDPYAATVHALGFDPIAEAETRAIVEQVTR